MTGSSRLEELRAQARFDRQRYDLYRARAYGSRPVDQARMRELERAAAASAERLRHAEAGADPDSDPGDGVP
jgi:hypothetical protein